MSQENVEIVRQAIGANRSGDDDATVEAAVGLADPSVEFRSLLVGVEGATYRGHRGIRRFFEDMADSWEEWRNEPEEISEIGPDRVFTRLVFRAVGKNSGVAVERRAVVVFVLSEGKLLQVSSYATRAEALEAVGLTE